MKLSSLLRCPPAKQKGVVLIMSLVLLFVLSVAVSTNINAILVEEKVVINQKDRFLAMEAAESALREAEAKITQQQNEPSATFSDGSKLFTTDEPKNLNDTREWCVERNANWWKTQATEASFTGVTVKPRYVIEDYEHVQDSLVIGQQKDDLGREFYRVTARGVGGTDTARVVLQTTFTKRY